MFRNIDLIIVGAGPAGATVARELADNNKKVLIIEKKNHIAGHCYDYQNIHGIYIHKFGPHIFHTKLKDVWEFTSRFTEWYHYQHKVIGSIDSQHVPIPFNLNSIDKLFSGEMAGKLSQKLIDLYGYGSRVPILELRYQQDKDLKFLAEYIYEKVFLNYTAKQWGESPDKIDPEVSGRVPVVISRDDCYFNDQYQGVPKQGYTNLFTNMLDHKNIHLLLNTDSRDIITLKDNKVYLGDEEFKGEVIFTGMIDELFEYKEGKLPYRSLHMEFEDINTKYFQENSLVNYPNNYDFTRITEFKYFQTNRDDIPLTTICREFPTDYVEGENDPFYVINNKSTKKQYNLYLEMAKKYDNIHFVGRLANYRYYNMDEVIKRALIVANDILDKVN